MRVLLVEDDPTTSKSIEMMLTHANLNVYATDLGEEGIDLAKLYDYDLILLDINLPDMNGHEVLRQLRLSKIETPILAGRQDTVAGYRDTWKSVEHFPRATFATLDGCGHFIAPAKRDLFRSLIIDWLERMERDGGG